MGVLEKIKEIEGERVVLKPVIIHLFAIIRGDAEDSEE
jgi:hypothetical protein